MWWRCRASEVVDLIDLEFEWLGDVVADELKIRVIEQVHDIAFAAREEVVEADDFVTFVEKSLAKMRTKESGATGDQNAHARKTIGQGGPDKHELTCGSVRKNDRTVAIENGAIVNMITNSPR